jgi:xylose isomerase
MSDSLKLDQINKHISNISAAIEGLKQGNAKLEDELALMTADRDLLDNANIRLNEKVIALKAKLKKAEECLKEQQLNLLDISILKLGGLDMSESQFNAMVARETFKTVDKALAQIAQMNGAK